MKRRVIVTAMITVFSMALFACGGTVTETTIKVAQESNVSTLDSVEETEAAETTNTVEANQTARATTTVEEAKNYIQADADDYTWPEAAAESDFDFDTENQRITLYKGTAAVVVIPEKIGGKPVMELAGTFDQNKIVTHVKVPEGVRLLSRNAFYFCENLEYVVLPSTLEAIDPFVFFSNAKLKNLSLPATLSFIGSNAFTLNTALEKVTFLGEVPSIAADAFDLAENSQTVFVVADEEKDAYEEALERDCEIAGACNYIDRSAQEADFTVDTATGAITAYRGDSSYIVFPSKIGATEIKKLGEKVLMGNQRVRRITIAEGVKEIGELAFAGARIYAIDLPAGLERIGQSAGGYLGTDLYLPEGLVEIGDKAFSSSNLENVYFPATIKTIGAEAFNNNSALSYLVFSGKTVPTIGTDAFKGAAIADIDIAVDATKEEARAFGEAFAKATGLDPTTYYVWRANLPDAPPYPSDYTKLAFDEGTGLVSDYSGTDEAISMYWNFWNNANTATIDITGLAPGSFEGSNLKRFTVPRSDAFLSIGDRAFANSKLEQIDLFDSVTTIGESAFEGCVDLKSITIPESVTSIGANAFKGCTGLTQIVLPAAVTLGGDLGLDPEKVRFSDAATDEQLADYAVQLGLPWYLSALRVSDKGGFQVMPDTYKPNAEADFEFDAATGTILKYIGEGGQLVIPRTIGGVTVKKIGLNAFSNLTIASVAAGTDANKTLKSVIVPETVTAIEDSAFLQCESLEKFECYGPIELVGIRAFENCLSLKELKFVNGVKELGVYCFNLCESLESVNFNGKLKVLPEGAFFGCGFKTEQILNYDEVGQMAFKQCAALPSVVVTEQVKTIGPGAFAETPALKKVSFEKADSNILGLGNFQFSESTKGLKIVLPNTATDEEVADFVSIMKQNLLAEAETMVVKE